MTFMRETRPKQARLSAADWLEVPANFGSIRSVLASRNITPGRMCKIAGGLTPRTLYDFLKKGSELRILYVEALVKAFHVELTFEGVAIEARETALVRERLEGAQRAENSATRHDEESTHVGNATRAS